MHIGDLNSVTALGEGRRKDTVCIYVHSRNSAQTEPRSMFFLIKVPFWMVISYMAGTSAGAEVTLQIWAACPRAIPVCGLGARGSRHCKAEAPQMGPWSLYKEQ